MKCTNCGKELSGSKFCSLCGTAAPAYESPLPPPIQPNYMAEAKLPLKYKPLSPWAYFGLSILFSLPVLGFILLIVFSLDDSNIHRRNYARSYWCKLLLSVAIIVLLVVLLLATGLAADIVDEVQNLPAI